MLAELQDVFVLGIHRSAFGDSHQSASDEVSESIEHGLDLGAVEPVTDSSFHPFILNLTSAWLYLEQRVCGNVFKVLYGAFLFS